MCSSARCARTIFAMDTADPLDVYCFLGDIKYERCTAVPWDGRRSVVAVVSTAEKLLYGQQEAVTRLAKLHVLHARRPQALACMIALQHLSLHGACHANDAANSSLLLLLLPMLL